MLHTALVSTAPNILLNKDWVRWNEEQWGLKAERVQYSADENGICRLEGWLYLNRNGHVVMPPRNPYMALRFTGTSSQKKSHIYRQWLTVSNLFAADLAARGTSGSLALPPGLIDARSFQWRDFDVGVAFTTVVPFPLNNVDFHRSIMKNVRKAVAAGYEVAESNDWSEVEYCLRQSEARKSFSHRVTVADMERCYSYLGRSRMRAYVGYDRGGGPVCAQLRLFELDADGLGWSAGTHSDHLSSGINQLTYLTGLNALASEGVGSFDLCGSNIREVAEAKSAWGGALVPYVVLREPGLRFAARTLVKTVRWLRRKSYPDE